MGVAYYEITCPPLKLSVAVLEVQTGTGGVLEIWSWQCIMELYIRRSELSVAVFEAQTDSDGMSEMRR